MAVKILIRRNFPAYLADQLSPLIVQMRTVAMSQAGYITGETLRRMDRPGEYLVISTWASLEDWNKWLESKDRQQIQEKIDEITGHATEYVVYEPIACGQATG